MNTQELSDRRRDILMYIEPLNKTRILRKTSILTSDRVYSANVAEAIWLWIFFFGTRTMIIVHVISLRMRCHSIGEFLMFSC